jgi:hypothetical protein
MTPEKSDARPRTRVGSKSTGPSAVTPDKYAALEGFFKEAEDTPAMEVHLGDVFTGMSPLEGMRARPCIIWLNGQRWQGVLVLQEAGT